MTTSDSIVIIPTYNEKENIEKIIRAVFGLEKKFDILIIDDGSPDGTAAIVKQLMAQEFKDRLSLVERQGKLGLGTAYIAGFKWALERNYDYIFEMDADFSHDPNDLPRLYSACHDEGYDVAIGSRYVSGVNVVNWPMGRVLMSYFASKYVRLITGFPIHDTTAGFKCYKRRVLQTIELDKIRFKGYGFQIEMKFTAWRIGFKIKEVPVIFVNRKEGESKMSGGIFGEAFFGVMRLRWDGWTRKYPRITLAILFSLILNTASAQVQDTLRVLAIGNSFSEDAVEQYLWDMGQEAGINLIIGNAYRGGWSLMSHWKDARLRASDTEYRKVTDGERINLGKHTLRDIITDEPWDVITLQQVSQDAGRIDSYEPGLSLMIGYVRALALVDTVKLGFHQTWAYSQDAEHSGFANYNRDQMLMYSCITAAVDKTMRYHQGDLSFYIPSGTAIQNARTTLLTRHSTDEQTVNRQLTRDGYHLNYTIGRYIVACTWFEMLTGRSSVGLRSRPKDLIPELAIIAQKAAHAAVLSPMSVTPL